MAITNHMKRNKLLFTLGVFCLVYWVFDFINLVFLVGKPEFILWYSVLGFFLTSIALIRQSPIFISIMFTTLFVGESLWMLDFLGKIFFDQNFLDITNYLFATEFTKKDFFFSMYHLYIPPILIIAVSQTKKVFRYSWVIATMYTFVLSILTFFLVDRSENVNCVHQLTRCKGVFLSFFFNLAPYPYHILIILLLMTVVIYIPTNYLLLAVGKKLNWTEISGRELIKEIFKKKI